MLAQDHDFVVARDRAAGLRLIEAGNAEVAVVDDAHQNLAIAKDLHILVVDGDTTNGAWPFGDGGISPYGPLRESLAAGLARADACVIWLPDENAAADPALLALLAPKPVFTARLTARKPATPGRVHGFAAIAKPWKFAATLRALGYDVAGFQGFPDHAALSEAQLRALEAAADGAQLITTGKDWIKLNADWRKSVAQLPIAARFDDESAFAATLEKAVSSR